jgi:threonylcarbamoyladenosine tRNA methylthiotransferase MtaB
VSGPRVAIVTLGCKVNAYDTAAIGERLIAAGCRLVPADAPADVVVINSCTVTNAADAEARRLARQARRDHPRARVVVTGCYAQTRPAEVARLEAVDHVIGLGRLERLVEAVTAPAGIAERIDVLPARRAGDVSTLGARSFPGHTRAFLKVQEGCDLFCTFCIVPMARGRSRSVEPRRVLAEVEAVAAGGFEEIVLTGVHLGGYGADLPGGFDLSRLVETIAERAAVARIRLSSIDPHEVSERLLHVMRDVPAVCDHLHVPLQAGDDGVLARMRRRYDAALARERLAMIREVLPGAQIGTDLIAGFPGEDDAAFERTLAFVAASPVTYAHVFPYSVRSGTTAAKLDGRVAAATIHERTRRLRGVCATAQETFLRGFDGTRAEVLVERRRDRRTGALRGYTRNYIRVTLTGPDALCGRRVPVRLAVDGASVRGLVAA